MKSHSYQFSFSDLAQLAGPPCFFVALFAVVMHLGAWLNVLPKPRPTHDMDHTILVHQAEAARRHNPVDLLLLGDSSCMMNVSVKSLEAQLDRKALNLGSVSYLDLKAYASMLRSYVKANPGAPRAVVLLMHPEALRRPGPDARYSDFLVSVLQGNTPARIGQPGNRFNTFAGVETFKTRLLGRWLPTPLPASFAGHYGFTPDLERRLEETGGSLIDPAPQPFKGSAEYRLAKQLEPASRAFKEAVPSGAKLFVAITPVPESFPGTNYAALHAQMLKDWSQWLQAEPLPLPATLPDRLFSKTTHLNEAGVQVYTEMLGKALPPLHLFP